MSAGTPRRWGAHELGASWAERVAGAAVLAPGDLVLDLGAGSGALTVPLARRGARVLAVELHAGRARALRRRVASLPAVTVVEQDLLALRLPRRPYRVVANPPYAVAAALVRRLTARGTHLARADLVLPRWQVRRYVARPPAGFTARAGQHVPASAFHPPPRQDSAVLVLVRRPGDRTRRRLSGRRAMW